MAKAPIINKKGKEFAEYPKLIRVGPYVSGDKGVHTAPQVRVENEDEEAEVRKKYNLDGDALAEKAKPAGKKAW